MAILARALKTIALWNAIDSVTTTPLLGFVVGDKRPSVTAAALHMLLAVLLMAAALAVTMADGARHRRARVRHAGEHTEACR